MEDFRVGSWEVLVEGAATLLRPHQPDNATLQSPLAGHGSPFASARERHHPGSPRGLERAEFCQEPGCRLWSLQRTLGSSCPNDM